MREALTLFTALISCRKLQRVESSVFPVQTANCCADGASHAVNAKNGESGVLLDHVLEQGVDDIASGV